MEEYTNALISEESPYLLQHAHNPVNWIPWSDDLFDRARQEGKMVLISVGYSACHWCHVMEKECFEDEEVAALMNKFFLNVKVDREERPDVDQLYMTAVHLMTNKGGWPLNCFTMPDGSPVYGGTYFQKEQWMHVLRSLHHTFINDRERMDRYAEDLLKGVKQAELIDRAEEVGRFEESKLTELLQRWSKSFDRTMGGGTRAPKFPLPSNLEFLLDFGINSKDEQLLAYVKTTLDRMAMGGIYDQIGGGFSRYSVDMLWKVPHFEKMLYDNGQLLSIYARAYKHFGSEIYRQVVYQTIEWLSLELGASDGAFYSALDADSEGEEGRFYVWTENELKQILGKEFEWVKTLYSVNERGYWEEGKYILLRTLSDQEMCSKLQCSIEELYIRIKKVNELLMSYRSDRVRPGLDTKCLTGWNAMTVRGLCEAFKAFGEDEFLIKARKCAKWMLNRIEADGKIWRSIHASGKKINGFLEDYAFTIDAFIVLGEVTGEQVWLDQALKICEYAIHSFRNEDSRMFYMTEAENALIVRKMELQDNVIPSGNSVMARNLYYLGRIFDRPNLKSDASQMLANVYSGMEMYGSGYSNWAILLEHHIYSMFELVCTGPRRKYMAMELQKQALPFSLILFSDNGNSELPVFEGRENNEDMIYVCLDGTCLAPVKTVTDAMHNVIQ